MGRKNLLIAIILVSFFFIFLDCNFAAKAADKVENKKLLQGSWVDEYTIIYHSLLILDMMGYEPPLIKRKAVSKITFDDGKFYLDVDVEDEGLLLKISGEYLLSADTIELAPIIREIKSRNEYGPWSVGDSLKSEKLHWELHGNDSLIFDLISVDHEGIWISIPLGSFLWSIPDPFIFSSDAVALEAGALKTFGDYIRSE